MEISCTVIDSGFDHLETLANVHGGENGTPESTWEAFIAVQEWLGMDEESGEALIGRIDSFIPASRKEAASWVFLGYMAGLISAHYAFESD